MNGTSEVIARFNDVFQRHDPTALPELVGDECVLENSQPAPDGSRHVGREACVELWTRIATTPNTRFDLEDVTVAGELAIIRWRFWWGDEPSSSVRGVNVMLVQNGRIVEGRGYVKGT